MSGEPIRLLDDSSIRDELRQRLLREASVKPPYDVERGLARLRVALVKEASGSGSSSASEPPSARLSVTPYAVKGSVWKLAGVVGLAATAAIVGLHAWGPARHVARADAASLPVQATAPPRPEADNLAEIQAALVVDPSAALRLVDDGNRMFATGSLRDEREVSAIAALSALGRRDEAQARARRFLEDHPKSSLSERVRQSARF
jgi:hypothetical protein